MDWPHASWFIRKLWGSQELNLILDIYNMTIMMPICSSTLVKEMIRFKRTMESAPHEANVGSCVEALYSSVQSFTVSASVSPCIQGIFQWHLVCPFQCINITYFALLAHTACIRWSLVWSQRRAHIYRALSCLKWQFWPNFTLQSVTIWAMCMCWLTNNWKDNEMSSRHLSITKGVQ